MNQKFTDKQRRFPAASQWVGFCLVTLLLYGLCLRVLFPGYFHPLAPFHTDIYRYVGDRTLGWITILGHYPRPAAYAAEKILAVWGLDGFMAAEILVSLSAVLLTIGLFFRLVGRIDKWLWAGAVLYLFLLMAHPDFYFEHRHDEPAEVSFLCLIGALHFWLTWVRSEKILALPASLVCGVIFAFSKETFYLAAPCLILALCVGDRKNWRKHVLFGGVLLLFAGAAVGWSRHLNSPFVDPNAAATDPYHIDLSVRSLFHWYWYFVRHCFTAWSGALIFAVILLQLAEERALSIAFVLSGVATYAPHAVLSRHIFEEYSWVGAPLALLPALFVFSLPVRPEMQKWFSTGAILLTLLSVFGPGSYRTRYGVKAETSIVVREKLSYNLLQSIDRLRQLPQASHILVTGLETPFVPWAVPSFIQVEFGDQKHWTVLLRPDDVAFQNGVAPFVSLKDIHTQDIDYVARYDPTGKLVGIEDKQWLAKTNDSAMLVPVLAEAKRDVLENSNDLGVFLRALNACISWGALDEADQILAIAKEHGFGNKPEILYSAGKLRAQREQWQAEARQRVTAASAKP